MAMVVFICVDDMNGFYTTFAFVLGAITSMFCGGFGMQIATFSNYRTAICAKTSLGYAFKTAFRAGVIMGFSLVSVSVLVLLALILAYKSMLDLPNSSNNKNYY
jgi:Na+/H+-translocating membrane pyrophosphatase